VFITIALKNRYVFMCNAGFADPKCFYEGLEILNLRIVKEVMLKYSNDANE